MATTTDFSSWTCGACGHSQTFRDDLGGLRTACGACGATVERACLEAAELTSEGMQDTADRRQRLDLVYSFNPLAEGIEHEDGLRDATTEAMRRDAARSQPPSDA